MRSGWLSFTAVAVLATVSLACSQIVAAQAASQGGDFSGNLHPKTKIPEGVILVKGAWASASDAVTPLPEGGTVIDGVYSNRYFGLAYTLPQDWTQKYYGPPLSDSGYYVLAQIKPAETYKGTSRGSILIGAQDLFFTLTPAGNALESINYTKDKLQADYRVELPPTPVSIANHSFVRFDYYSPVAELHWRVLATQIRCHLVQFIFTSQDTKWMENLIGQMNEIKLPAEASLLEGTGGDDVPVCIKDYARAENVLERSDAVFTQRRFNPIPVRIIIDKEGKIKHIHFLSAFPDQAKLLTEALWQWRFKPYLRDGKPVEVETGIMFGASPRAVNSSAVGAVNE